MKKLISIALMLALCLTLFAGCDITSLFTPDPSEGLLAAKDYLDDFMSEQTTTTSLDFEVMPVVANEFGSFPIEWTSDNANITFAKNEESGLLNVILPGCAAEVVTFTLTATLSEESGAKVSSTFTFTIPAATYVVAPEAGKTYKLGFVSNYDENQAIAYYFTGKMSGFYGGTTVAFDAAKDVTLEEAEGGYYLTFMDGQTKKYIGVVYELSSSDNNYHLNFVLKDTATSVFTYNTKLGTFVTKVTIEKVETDCYLGTSGKYNTFDSITDLKADTWLAHLYEKDVNPDFNANDPADGTTLTIPEANELGKSKFSGLYTSNKYSVTGKITEIKDAKYGNLYIADEAGNKLYVYGLYNANGETRFDKMETKPSVGDTITVYGILGNYNKDPQMKDGWMTAHTAHTCEYSDPTCTEAATCIHCGATTGDSLGHTDANKDHTCDIESCGATNVGTHADGDDEDLLCDYGCGKEITATDKPAAPVTATIDLNNADNRTSYTAEQQVWASNGITVTNNKAGSSNDVGDYTQPARFYKSSDVIISFDAGITKITFNCDNYKTSYPTDLATTLTNAGYTPTVDGTVVTIELTEAVTSITLTSMAGQVRIDTITIN